jgi:sarcosine oxidase gamma subunit
MSTSAHLGSRALEFKAFEFPLVGAAAAELPAAPGAVHRDTDIGISIGTGTGAGAGAGIGDSNGNGSRAGRAALLHFAPGRFLAPAPTPDTERRLHALQAAGAGAVFDVEGKWQAFALTAPGAERALSSTIDLAQALGGRDCAALYLFDCPAVLSRCEGGFDVWVEASYAVAFRELLGGTDK